MLAVWGLREGAQVSIDSSMFIAPAPGLMAPNCWRIRVVSLLLLDQALVTALGQWGVITSQRLTHKQHLLSSCKQ